MLRRRDQYTFLLQAGRVANAGDVSPNRFDLKTIEVHAPEYHTRSGGSGKDS
jgi:hypothetical protein